MSGQDHILSLHFKSRLATSLTSTGTNSHYFIPFVSSSRPSFLFIPTEKKLIIKYPTKVSEKQFPSPSVHVTFLNLFFLGKKNKCEKPISWPTHIFLLVLGKTRNKANVRFNEMRHVCCVIPRLALSINRNFPVLFATSYVTVYDYACSQRQEEELFSYDLKMEETQGHFSK